MIMATGKEHGGEPLNFVEEWVKKALDEGKNDGRLQTRFPPEPNGYLHIGHAKAICMDFGVAERFGGFCNLRFDDTNPTKEDNEYVEAIMEDIHWLGFQWRNVYYASDYFGQLYDFALRLIRQGKAYVDEQSRELIEQQRGTPMQPGVESPFRNRPVEESLDLFERMNAGEFPEGSMVLRSKIDMASGNMHFRDPIIYRILKAPHWRTGTTWGVYPMYDFAHGQSDYFEGVTHSICTLEFEVHRPLYDYFVDELKEGRDLEDHRPRQLEFNRLNLTYTIMSKRKLLALVQEHLVNGWDDPRMPTLCGLRRRGYSPESIRRFVGMIGYTKYDALNDYAMLEAAAREDLNGRATRLSAVLDPVRLIITNYPQDAQEEVVAVDNPEDPQSPTHTLTFSGDLWIEREDFMEEAPKKFYRLSPGREVRLKGAYIVRCTGCKKGADGRVEEVYCEYDPTSKSGLSGADRKVKATLHWLSRQHCLPAEVRLYERLFTVENPAADERDFRELLNPQSLSVRTNCYVEPYAAQFAPKSYLQFQRIGYFTPDYDSGPDHLVFNRTVGLRDNWAKKLKNGN